MGPRSDASPLLLGLVLLAGLAWPASGSSAPAPAQPAGAPMSTASRTSGVAPLAVFFDCVDVVAEGPAAPFTWRSGVVQPADGDHEGPDYRWDFGDPGAGTWSTTGQARNAATGYTAAHVYEAPGRYTATLTVTDRAGTVRIYQQAITVTAFRGTTYFVSAEGRDANDGLTPATPFRTAARGLAQASAPNRRILFRRGDTFPVATALVSADGPGLIGAYGTGRRPVLASGITDGGALVIRGADWRVMDLEITGPGVGESGAIGFDVSHQTRNALFLRLVARGWNVGLGWGDWTPILATPHDGATVMECEVAAARTNGMYLGGHRLALLGNDVHDVATSHVLRVWQAHKGVISHNRLWNPGPTRHALKLHGGAAGDGRPETRWVTITDNLFRGTTWSVTIGPQDSGSDERVSHVLFERNRFTAEASVQVDLSVWARQVMVRNNVFDGTGASRYYTAISVARRGVEPPPREVRLLHNTVVRDDAASEFSALGLDATAGGITFRNNLVSAPRATSPALRSGQPGTGLLEDHNRLTSSPGFVDARSGDYRLRPSSPAIDAGAWLWEVRADLRGAARPAGAAPDLGAFEFGPAALGTGPGPITP